MMDCVQLLLVGTLLDRSGMVHDGFKFPPGKLILDLHLGVSINGGTQKWLVYIGKSHLGMDVLGVPPFQETPICHTSRCVDRSVSLADRLVSVSGSDSAHITA